MTEGMTVPSWDMMYVPAITKKDRDYMRLAIEVADMSKCCLLYTSDAADE